MKQKSETISYPVGIQDFRKLRENGFLYVDKTDIIFQLIRQPQYAFLSRPRRFGKSLLISTIQAFFEGRRELFKGLAIDSMVTDWTPHPVLHLDMNSGEYKDESSLRTVIEEHLKGWEALYGTDFSGSDLSLRFGAVIRKAYEATGQPVVILIDEYDKPLIQALENESLAETFRQLLRAVYSNLKTQDRYIRFTLITGVARFSKLSVFSDTNNLRDISFSRQFSTICGITNEELDKYFQSGIRELARETGLTLEETREQLRKRYDGYHFAVQSPDIYNPYSLITVFADMRFDSYWSQTGTPTYIAKLIRTQNMSLPKLEDCMIQERVLTSTGLNTTNPIPLLYQAGYLTIKGTEPRLQALRLGYPNEEVKEAFMMVLLPLYTNRLGDNSDFNILEFSEDILKGDVEAFMTRLAAITASVPYTSKEGSVEARFEAIIYLVFSLLGFLTRTEIRTSTGRIDLTVETPSDMYIMEFKTNSPATVALEQIRDRKYVLPYQASEKDITLIGASFDSKERILSEWICEKIKRFH